MVAKQASTVVVKKGQQVCCFVVFLVNSTKRQPFTFRSVKKSFQGTAVRRHLTHRPNLFKFAYEI